MNVRETTVAVGLGTNLGDRAANLAAAGALLRQLPHSRNFRFSAVFETDPVDCQEPLPFLNAAACFETRLSPETLLNHLLTIEARLGRRRTHRNAPRIIDLDILLYGDTVSSSERLTVPHPRLAQRAFALMPLADIWPDAIHPIEGQTVAGLLAALSNAEAVTAKRHVAGPVALFG